MYNSINFESDDLKVIYSVLGCADDGRLNDFCYDKYSILYFTEGSGKCIVEGKEYTIKPSNMIALPPLTFHRIISDDEHILKGYLICFNLNAISDRILKIIDKVVGSTDKMGRFYPSSSVSDSVANAIERLEFAELLPEPQQTEYIKALLTEILVFMSIEENEDGIYSEDELGARVVRYLNNCTERNISLDKLSRRFFVSKYYLCRAFKKHSGTSVHSYINHKRIMYAKQLIESGETASAAAYKVGFGDYSAFYRAYVKIVGKSPTSN